MMFKRYNDEIHDFYLDYEWSTLTSTNPVTVDTERICREQTTGCDVVDSSTYLTVDITNAVVDWLDNSPTEPWFLYVAHFAPHGPWNCPPSDAYTGTEYGLCTEANPTDLDAYRGMMQVFDEQLDRILSHSAVDIETDTYVFFLSDNGTPGEDILALTPFTNENRVKGTVFEGGVRVPCFVGGPDTAVVDGALDDELFINVSDVYATILELAGVTANPNDEYWERNQSQSFLDYITTSSPSRIRECAYTELFEPNGIGGSKSPDRKAFVGTTTLDTDIYKYITTGTAVGLYNLTEDPFETNNLCGTSGCGTTEDDIIDEILECADQFRDTSCTDGDLGEACSETEPCCPGLFCSEQTDTCVDPI